MKKIWKRGLSFVLAMVMVAGLLPVTAFAAVDSTGKPTDLNNTLVLSIYTPEGSFPGEPAMHGSDDYISFNSKFAKTSASGKFKDNATDELKNEILNDMVQGASSGNNTVWGVFSADGLKEKYFKSGASIIQPKNEAEIIRVIKGNTVKNWTDKEILDEYEIIWYVIKLQHSPASNWWGRATTEWHIDGVIREKKEELITINYYGNGNTEGSAPDGVTNHVAGDDYSILAGTNMKKKIGGVYVDFLGWSAKADGTGAEAGFYKPGDVINPTENISLYAMWDTTTQYTATVNTYLDNVLADEEDIHGTDRDLYLGTEGHYYQLTRTGEGVYTVKITGNGKFHLYNKIGNDYTQVGDRQLTIYNQNGSMDIHHYSVTYNANEGDFETEPGKQIFYYGNAVTAIETTPTREGYRFLGWSTEQNATDNLIQPGEEVTASITDPIVLYAQWEKTVNVIVNVTIDHNGGDGYDQAPEKDHVTLTVASKADENTPYLEIGEDLNLTNNEHDGFQYSHSDNRTTYTQYTLTDMPGGTAEYTVVTSKSGYETTIAHTQDADGNWIINVEMAYKPSNFDLQFTVEVAESVPDAYLPEAAIVKVTFWATGKQAWETITQQAGSEPGVRVNIDPSTRKGSGSYPVWKYESNGETPYGNRIEVTAFVYPDGTIVPASAVQTDVVWSDNVYTATAGAVKDGRQYGTLYGAYYDKDSDSQKGTLNAVITMDLHNVTFDAQGGKVNGLDEQTVTQQYKIPAFNGYVPTRDGGYLFDGWYEDDAYTTRATEGKDLTKDVTLYAKWIEPLTISGTVTISGTYQQNNETVSVHDIDRATEAVVVLQELRNGTAVEVDSVTVTFGNYTDEGNAEYTFAQIPNDGKQYQIHVLVQNYNTGYDNESDADLVFTPNEYAAVFGGDNVAVVDAHLDFAPPSYDQKLTVNATAIGAVYRPKNVLAEVLYRDTGDNHAFQRISQHDVEPYGVVINLTNNGTGTGSQSVWNWHTDGTLYDYQMNISKVDGVAFNTDSAPYYITYSAANNANTPAVELVATLIPHKYPVTFNLNAGTDTVTGMEDFEVENADVAVPYAYAEGHTWSYETKIEAVPVREGYTFQGWETTVENVTSDEKGNITIGASVHEAVELKAKWKQITYEVTVAADPEAGGTLTGEGTYAHGAEVTIKATPAAGYTFLGWYENEKLISMDAEYKFTIKENHDFVAEFSLNQHTVTTKAIPEAGGTTTGDGTYDYGTEITLTATANPGYTFVAWQKDTAVAEKKEVSRETSFTVTVTENATYEAVFTLNKHTVTTNAKPSEGGTTTGDGTFNYGTNVTVKAEANTGYTFTGWYEGENLACKTADYTFTVTADRLLEARFEKITYEVTVSAEVGGTAAHDGKEGAEVKYSYGDTATVKATVNETYTFAGWYEGETLVSKNLEYTFTVTSDRELTAKFTKNGFNVTTSHTDGGTTDGDGYYGEKDTATVTATAKEGYRFVGWFENGEEVSKDASYSFTVIADRKLDAKFVKVYTITTVASPEVGGTTTQYCGETIGSGAYESGTDISIVAQEKSGYYFIGWYDEKDDLITAEKTFSWNVQGSRTFTAKFEAKVAYRCDYVYIFGYTDSVIGAEGPLLRGELAQMIYRLVKQNTGAGHGNRTFDDTQGQWYRTGISYMVTMGAIDGSKANAYPEVSVTRGETYKMICLGLGFTTDASLNFSEYATILRNSGFISGDGRVTEKIQRWEFCALFNAILGRTGFELKDASGNVITHETYNYTDLDPSQHYYETMLIATSTFTNGKVDLAKRAQRNPLDEYGG